MDRVTDVVKKNLISIICGVVALIAILAVFWPISGMFSDLQTKAAARGSVYNQLRELSTKQRSKPVVSLQEGASGEALEVFPTDAVIQRGERVKQAIEAEAQAMYQEAVKLNQGDKKPLVPEALPQPPANKYTAIANNFQREYARAMDYANPDSRARAQSMPGRVLKAGVVPTAEQIKAEQDRIAKIIRTNELQVDPKGKPLNEPQVAAKIQAQTELVGEQMRHDVAKSCLVYVDPGSFDVMDRILPPARAPLPPDIFWAQIGYWVHQDVCRAVADANAGATDVTNAAVKRVIRVDLPEIVPPTPHAFTLPSLPSASGSGGIEDGSDPSPFGSPVPSDPSQPIPPNFSVSPTGRYSNPLYDVVQFKLSLIVDGSKIPQVLQAISKDRFITVYKTDITAVDSGEHQAEGYIYGPNPVARMDVECEALFMRDWTSQYMPAIVKRNLGIVDQPAAVQ